MQGKTQLTNRQNRIKITINGIAIFSNTSYHLPVVNQFIKSQELFWNSCDDSCDFKKSASPCTRSWMRVQLSCVFGIYVQQCFSNYCAQSSFRSKQRIQGNLVLHQHGPHGLFLRIISQQVGHVGKDVSDVLQSPPNLIHPFHEACYSSHGEQCMENPFNIIVEWFSSLSVRERLVHLDGFELTFLQLCRLKGCPFLWDDVWGGLQSSQAAGATPILWQVQVEHVSTFPDASFRCTCAPLGGNL